MKRGSIVSILFLIVAGVAGGVFQEYLALTGSQAIALAILLWAAILWTTEIVPLFVTSFIILFMEIAWLRPELALSGKKTAVTAFLQPFFSDIIVLFMGGFVLSQLMHRYAIDRRAAGWIMGKVGGNQRLLMMALMATAAFFSMWMSNTATAAMMFAIIVPILDALPEKAPYARALTLAIPFSCNLGGIATPIGTPPNAIAIAYLKKAGIDISFTGWMALSFPLMVILLLLLALTLIVIYGIGSEKIEFNQPEDQALTPKHWAVVGLFLVTALGWMTSELHGIPVVVISLIPLIVGFGTGLLNQNDFNSLSWDVLFMMGGGLALGVALTSSGLTDRVIAALPLQAEPWMLLVIFTGVAVVMTSFMSNTATANLLIPVAVSLPGEVGIMALAIGFTCSTAMPLPISTPPNAIAFNSGVITIRDMLKSGLVITLVSYVFLLTAGRFFWKFLGY